MRGFRRNDPDQPMPSVKLRSQPLFPFNRFICNARTKYSTVRSKLILRQAVILFGPIPIALRSDLVPVTRAFYQNAMPVISALAEGERPGLSYKSDSSAAKGPPAVCYFKL